ncbi:hypothetical protein Lepto7376_3923 [[Leptolyngbya] sp. PCC 7376]|uniref:hypothetical protein n=1 Tax=[Leptolyngbya] sp. PCC 7376 TaxID=111781 RepID=UPI00029F0019|nr:hypothetical protein [[Leptolyngbya] sp. PCC 7376]AFY40072.1 hypothetical protein Lepto7376_3923 [[Leptolyngbya] sp. PCC 7376]
MFKFDYASAGLKEQLTKVSLWDEFLKDELSPVLNELRQRGESSLSPDYGYHIFGNALRLRGRTFEIVYSVNSQTKVIRFYECKFIASSQSLDWQRLLLEDSFHYSPEAEIVLPQVGIKRLMLALKCISDGHNTTYQLGVCAGSRAQNPKNISRHGQYGVEFLKQCGLIREERVGQQAAKYYCSDKIQKAFQANDESLVLRLVAESLLGFPVIKQAIRETTTGQKELTLELIQSIWEDLEPIRYGSKTKRRRAQSVRALINWLAREEGIPIRKEGSRHIQLFLDLNIYDSKF